MSAIFTTNAMIMGPAKMMDLACVMLDFSATTVPVNSKRTFIIENVGALPGFLILLTKVNLVFLSIPNHCIPFYAY